jgi:hypothetical protein
MLGIAVPEILLPAAGVDLSRFAVIACDQYTSQPDYWKAVAERVGEAPSALHLVLPEVWLGGADQDERIAAIQAHMREYLARGVFAPPLRAFVAVDRSTPHVASRRGLMVALDLDRYDWRPEARVARDRGDRRGTPAAAPACARRGARAPRPGARRRSRARSSSRPSRRSRSSAAYDVEPLMDGAGRVRGWAVREPGESERIERRARGARGSRRHSARSTARARATFLVRVGRRNHSLAR